MWRCHAPAGYGAILLECAAAALWAGRPEIFHNKYIGPGPKWFRAGKPILGPPSPHIYIYIYMCGLGGPNMGFPGANSMSLYLCVCCFSNCSIGKCCLWVFKCGVSITSNDCCNCSRSHCLFMLCWACFMNSDNIVNYVPHMSNDLLTLFRCLSDNDFKQL